MMPGPAYPYPIGARVALVDCNGGNRVEGEVIGTPGPWTIRVDIGRTVYLAAVGLVVERLDIVVAPAMSIFPTSKSAPKIDTPPATQAKGAQLTLF